MQHNLSIIPCSIIRHLSVMCREEIEQAIEGEDEPEEVSELR
jgi:hypothetical protein